MATQAAPRRPEPIVPLTMKVAVIDRFGPPDAITIKDVPTPEPETGEVLIAMDTAGVGVWDAEIRRGPWMPPLAKFPFVLGTDGAGVVAQKGEAVTRFNVGDRVWAYHFTNPKGGFYAEFVAVDSTHVGHVPRKLDLLHAGAAAVTGLTALQGIDNHLAVRARDTVLIAGASGAVGTLAVQFARRRHARVIGLVRGQDAVELLKHLGADASVDATRSDYLNQLRALAPGGIDAALVLAGGDAAESCLDFVRPGAWVAYPNGVEPEPRPRPNVRLIPYDAEAGPLPWERLAEAVEGMHLQVPIAATFPLEEAARAHARLEQGHVLGRIVLRCRAETTEPTKPEKE
jgi:NADPH:quinone reductase-like Zn-dependent oxidoreductase